ncbi:AAA domain-containing protein, putative AbiEii toxin, Type IV TA system [Chitinophaga sp. YR627]|uniref:AAA family ATPase n=1 Tax=Chitinophaga sp. YR627 TaxID=1881041 RepID=UPI0008E476DA|nr:AAA family ATPase [Chitinophaga sp. YR627]SFN49706.1 AAA domain-containing protein, putative AbiEii toxin, Type IV TA system [Chitinophaga sp. YR627]
MKAFFVYFHLYFDRKFMNNAFITAITINEVRNIRELKIPLSSSERKHLILTGKNGSGKTSVLEGLRDSLQRLFGLHVASKHNIEVALADDEVNSLLNEGKFVSAFFDSKRQSKFNKPEGIKKVQLKTNYHLTEKIANQFIQYIVNLKADRSFAKDENETEVVKEVDRWFLHFEKSLTELFGVPNLILSFDRKNYNFNIIEIGKEPYSLNDLSDGYSAVLSIVTELLLRMDSSGSKNYDVQGIVLIDEIETHLHIELQKKILPFLTSFFPKIQFIVTTHSPFVLSSIENAVVCDLEKKIVTDDLSGYSYDTLIESYFEADKYSTVLKNKMQEYEQLMAKESLQDSEKLQLEELKKYIEDVPKFLADELAVKIQQIQLKKLNNKKNQ